MHGRGRFGRGRWLVLALVLLGLVGQHCVLPTSAASGATHHHDPSGPGHGDHTFHAAPCDVVVAKTLSAAPAPVVSGIGLALPATPRHRPGAQAVAGPVIAGTGPPLYVLHASLLI